MVPVVVEDADRAVFTNDVDFPSGTPDEFAVVGEIARFDGCQIHIFFQDEHAILGIREKGADAPCC